MREDLPIAYRISQTDHGYTGQRGYPAIGLMDYRARFYSPALGRFIQPDTIVSNPANPQNLNRYAYVYNNPLRYNDPSGHTPACGFSYSDPECSELEQTNNADTPGGGTSGGGGGGGGSGGGGTSDGGGSSGGGAKPWRYSKRISVGFHIGPTSNYNQPDYYSDYPNDPAICSYAPQACLPDLILRFPFAYGKKSIENNFWVDFDVIYDETMGISISNMKIINYYDKPAILAAVRFESGGISTVLRDTGFVMPHGFGSDFSLPSPPKPFDGNNSLTITVEVGYEVNLPNGPRKIYPDYVVVLPSLPELKYFMETGRPLPVPPYLP